MQKLGGSNSSFSFSNKNSKVTTVRLFNTVGPRQTQSYEMFITRIINATLKDKWIKIFRDGIQSRVLYYTIDSVRVIIDLAYGKKQLEKF